MQVVVPNKIFFFINCVHLLKTTTFYVKKSIKFFLNTFIIFFFTIFNRCTEKSTKICLQKVLHFVFIYFICYFRLVFIIKYILFVGAQAAIVKCFQLLISFFLQLKVLSFETKFDTNIGIVVPMTVVITNLITGSLVLVNNN